MDTTHKCPCPGCHELVPARLYACPFHWGKLPLGVKLQIHETKHMHVLKPQRRAAFAAAAAAWRNA